MFDDSNINDDFVDFNEFVHGESNVGEIPEVGKDDHVDWMDDSEIDEDEEPNYFSNFYHRDNFKSKYIPRKVPFWNLNEYMIKKVAYKRAKSGPNTELNFMLLNLSTLEPELDLIPDMAKRYDVQEPHIYIYGKILLPNNPTSPFNSKLININGEFTTIYHDQILIMRVLPRVLNWTPDNQALLDEVINESKKNALEFNNFKHNFGDTFVCNAPRNESNALKSTLLSLDETHDHTVFTSLHASMDASSRGFLSDSYLTDLIAYINDNIMWRTKNDFDERKKKMSNGPAILGFSRIPPNYIEFPSIDGIRLRKKSTPRSVYGFRPDDSYDPNFYRLWLRSKEYMPYILKVIESPKFLQKFDFLLLYSDEDFDAQWRLTFGINCNEIYNTTNYRKLPQDIIGTFFDQTGTIPQTSFAHNTHQIRPLFLEVSYDSLVPHTTTDLPGKFKPHSVDLLSFDLECANHDHKVTGDRMFPVAYLTPQILQRQIAKTYLSEAAQKRINNDFTNLKCPDFCTCDHHRKLNPSQKEALKMANMTGMIVSEIEADERLIKKYPVKPTEWILDPVKDVDKIITICFSVGNIESTSYVDPCESTYHYILCLKPDNLSTPIINHNIIKASKRFCNTRFLLYDTEIDLILGFLDHIRHVCPGTISGYNITAFDFSYIQDRFKWYLKYGTLQEKQIVANNPFSISLISGFNRGYTTKNVFRPNLGLRTVYTAYPFIFRILDVYEGVNNETFSQPTKIRSFKLNSIAASKLFYPGTTAPMLKLMVDAAKGVEMWMGDTNTRTLFLFYCLWDAVLAFGLCRAYGFSKLKDSVSTTCGILPTLVFSTGVIEKILSLYRIFNLHGHSRNIMPMLKGKIMIMAHHPDIWLYSPSRCCDENLEAFPYAHHLVCKKTNLIIPNLLEVAARRWADNILKGEEKPFLPSINYDREFIVGMPKISTEIMEIDTQPTSLTPKELFSKAGLFIDPGIIEPPKPILKPHQKNVKYILPSEFPSDEVMLRINQELCDLFPYCDVLVGANEKFKTLTEAIGFLKKSKEELLASARTYLKTYNSYSVHDKRARLYYNFRLKTVLRMIDKIDKNCQQKIILETAKNNQKATPSFQIPYIKPKLQQLNILTGKVIESENNFKRETSKPKKKEAKPKKKKPFSGGYNKNMTRCFKNTFTVFKDFNSLYPSIEKAFFLCFENLFTNYMSAYVYPEVSPLLFRSTIIGTWEDTICGNFLYDPENAYREYYSTPFLAQTNWIQDPDCLTNQIVDTLLFLRQEAKNVLKVHTNQLCENQFNKLIYEYDSKSELELAKRLLDSEFYAKDNDLYGSGPRLNFLKKFGITEIKPDMLQRLESNDLKFDINDAKAYTKKTMLEIQIAIIYHKNLMKNFDIQQNGMKILNNSGFGFFGSQRGLRELASCICSRGRCQIQMSSTISENTCILKTMVRNCGFGPYVLSLGLHPGAWYPNQYDPAKPESTKPETKRIYDEHYVSPNRLKWPTVTEEHKQRKFNCSTYGGTDGGDTDSIFVSGDSKFMNPSNNGKYIPAANLDMIFSEKEKEKYKLPIEHYQITKKTAFYESEVITQRFLPLEFNIKFEAIPKALDVFDGTNLKLKNFFTSHNIQPNPAKTEPFWYQVASRAESITQKHFVSKKHTTIIIEANEMINYFKFLKTCGFDRILSQKIVVEKISDYFTGYGKKRYGYNNLEIKQLVIKGLSLVRGDALEISSKLLKSCFEKIFFRDVNKMKEIEVNKETKYGDKDLEDYEWRDSLDDPNVLSVVQMFEFLRDQLEKISENKNLDVSLFILSQRLKKDPSMYESELPHVTVATKMLQRGDTSVSVGSTIRYVYYLDPQDADEKKIQNLINPSKGKLKPKVILKPKKDEQTTSQSDLTDFFKPKSESNLSKMGKLTGSILNEINEKPPEVVLSHVFKRVSSSKMSVDTPEFVVNHGYTLDLQYYILEKIIPTLAIALSPFATNNENYPQVTPGMTKEQITAVEDKQKQFVEEQKRCVSTILITDKLKENLQKVIEYHNSAQLRNTNMTNFMEIEQCIVCLSYFRKPTFGKVTKRGIIEYPTCPSCQAKPEKVQSILQDKHTETTNIIGKYRKCVKKCERCIIRNEVGLNPDEINLTPEEMKELPTKKIWECVTKANNPDDIENMLKLDGVDYEKEPILQKIYPKQLWISNYFQCKFEECPTYKERSTLHLQYQKLSVTKQNLEMITKIKR